MNRSLERYARPMPSQVPAARRGLVNEAGFRVFVDSVAARTHTGALGQAAVAAAWEQGVRHIRTMRQFSREPIDGMPRPGELEEAVDLSERIALFFRSKDISRAVIEPRFNGCGWIEEATGDVLANETLFEFKAGERQFRNVDLHQLLTYCALNFATKALAITSVGLVNPRVGTFAVFELDALCNECAGTSSADVLDEILQYMSEPLGAYAR